MHTRTHTYNTHTNTPSTAYVGFIRSTKHPMWISRPLLRPVEFPCVWGRNERLLHWWLLHCCLFPCGDGGEEPFSQENRSVFCFTFCNRWSFQKAAFVFTTIPVWSDLSVGDKADMDRSASIVLFPLSLFQQHTIIHFTLLRVWMCCPLCLAVKWNILIFPSSISVRIANILVTSFVLVFLWSVFKLSFQSHSSCYQYKVERLLGLTGSELFSANPSNITGTHNTKSNIDWDVLLNQNGRCYLIGPSSARNNGS